MGNVLARKLEHVRRVVTHQVMQATEVAAPMLAVHAAKLIEENAGLVAIADAELQDVQLFRQRAPGRETVPQPKQPQDELARGLNVARVALAAGQGGLVALAGGLLPQRERLPVQGVEAPDQAAAAGSPALERQPGALLRVGKRGFDAGIHRVWPGATQVDGDFEAFAVGGWRARVDVPGLHAAQLDRVAEVLSVLDVLAHEPQPRELRRTFASGSVRRSQNARGVDRLWSPQAVVRPA